MLLQNNSAIIKVTANKSARSKTDEQLYRQVVIKAGQLSFH